MTDEPGQPLSDEELDRLARKLFAEVRAESPEAKAGRALESAGEVAGELIPGIPFNAECIVLRSAEAKVPTPVGQAALGSGS